MYDNLNQLVRENNRDLNKSWVMTYDNAGNILSKNEYVYTTGTPETPVSTMAPTYSTGDWKDLMTGLNGATVTYDTIGNPLTYYNGMSFTWQDGRKLSSAVLDEYRTVGLEYNSDGMLVKKTLVEVDGVTEVTEYFYTSGVLQAIKETWFYEGEEFDEHFLWFIYDETGDVIGFRKDNVTYYYSKNLQGDVLAILKQDGTLMGTYTYDAWGKVVKITNENGIEITDSNGLALMVINPIRYRSYCYDVDLGMYYLTTRFYDPYSCRFVNADGYVSTGQGLTGNNMFAYCGNNPVVRVDCMGYRYCEGTSVRNESSEGRKTALQWQNLVVRSKYNPKPTESSSDEDVYIVPGGNVHIIPNAEDVNNITTLPGDVIVVDNRDFDNPVMIILNSALIDDKDRMRAILEVLVVYEHYNPSDWDRNVDEMLVEWDAHNIFFNIRPNERCLHVNLDNKEKNKSYGYFVKKAIKSFLGG